MTETTAKPKAAPRRKGRPARQTDRVSEHYEGELAIPEGLQTWANENNYHLYFIRARKRGNVEDVENLEAKFRQGWSPVTIEELPAEVLGDSAGVNPFTGQRADKFIREGHNILAKIDKDLYQQRKRKQESVAVQFENKYIDDYTQNSRRRRGDGMIDYNESEA